MKSGILLEGLETFMRGRGGREYRTTDYLGKTVRVFNDGGTLCVELNGEVQPFLALSDNAQKEVADLTGAGFVVADVRSVSGIALGDSRIDKPGFPGAVVVGEAKVKETPGIDKYHDPAQNPFIRIGEPRSVGAGGELNKYLDPDQNPFILGGSASKKKESGLDKYHDPAQNPLIKID